MDPYHYGLAVEHRGLLRGGTSGNLERNSQGSGFLRLFYTDERGRVEIQVSLAELAVLARKALGNRSRRSRQGWHTAKVER
jgi:hypothetical protein